MSAFDDLIGVTDAQKWAHEFVKVAELRDDIPKDEGTMLGWFANAIMTGYDEGRRQERMRGFHELIREIAYQSAGAGSGAVMSKPGAESIIMPSEEISARVDQILFEFGIREEHEHRRVAGGSRSRVDLRSSQDTFAQGSIVSEERLEADRRKALRRETEPDSLLREHRPLEPEHG